MTSSEQRRSPMSQTNALAFECEMSMGLERGASLIHAVVLTTITGNLEERRNRVPIGRNNEASANSEDCGSSRFGGSAGFDGFSYDRPHFHSGAMIIAVDPCSSIRTLAARGRSVKFPRVGSPTRGDPLRVAEKVRPGSSYQRAVLTPAFARGLQDRWVKSWGQHTATGGPMRLSMTSITVVSRRVPRIMAQAWTEYVSAQWEKKYYHIP